MKTKGNRHSFGTRTIHAGQSPDPSTGAVKQTLIVSKRKAAPAK